MTINLSTINFETKKHLFTLIDVPGQRAFIKNMITGASLADVAMLIVSAREGEFETGFSLEGQTREHALIAHTLGVRQIIIAVNKMDAVDYCEKRFREIKQETIEFIKKVGFEEININVVAYSGYQGDNIIEKSDNLCWYEGDTLVEALDKFEPPVRLLASPLRISLRDVYNIRGVGTVPEGKVETGILRPNMLLTYAPCGITAECGDIQSNYVQLKQAISGDMIGFSAKNVLAKDIKRGYVVGDAQNDPPKQAISFDAEVIILYHPGKISVGYTPVVDCHTSHIACRVDKIHSIIDRRTGEVIEKEPKAIKSGQAALITMYPLKPMVVEASVNYPPLSRIIIRDMMRIVAVGIVKSVEKKKTN